MDEDDEESEEDDEEGSHNNNGDNYDKVDDEDNDEDDEENEDVEEEYDGEEEINEEGEEMDNEQHDEDDSVDNAEEEEDVHQDEEELSDDEDADVEEEFSDGTAEKDDGSNELDAEKKSPKIYELLHLWSAGKCNTVHFLSKGGETRVYDFNDQKERTELTHIIASPPRGATWTASHHRADTPKKSKSGKTVPKVRKAYAPGFSTGSDIASDEDEKSAAEQAALAPPEVTEKKKSGLGKRSEKDATTTKKKKKVTVAKKAKESATSKKSAAKSKGGKYKGDKRQDVADRGQKVSSKSTSGKSYRGKVVNFDQDDSDDDSLGINEEEMVKAMKDVQKAKAKKLVVISVSQGFVNVGTGERVYLVSFQSLRNVFYLKAEHFKSLLEMALQKRKALKPSEDGTWIETVDYYKLRSKEYGDESIWFRSEVKQNTVDLMYFVHKVPLHDEESFKSELDRKIKYFFDVTKKRKTNMWGEMALNYARGLSTGDSRGLGKYCLAKGGGDPAKAAKVMAKEIDDYWKHGPSVQYDVHLNKTMVDWDIKQFLTRHVGITSWDDLDENSKTACYRDYPKKSLPDWDDIFEESW